MSESHHQTSSSPPSGDDLQKIAGIGAALAARLADAGILSYQDLAAQTLERLAAVTRLPTAKITSLDWAGQARRLADGVPTETDDQQKYATFHVELLIDADNTVRRTKTRHYQTDTEDSWPGWDAQQLVALIRRKAGLDAEALRLAQPQHAQAPAVQVEGPRPAREGSRGTFRHAGQPTTTRLFLQVGRIDGADTDTDPGTVDFAADVEARPLGKNIRYPLATASEAITIDKPVNLELTGPPLPPGLHRLEATVAIYTHPHQQDAKPLCRHHSLGDLIYVAAQHGQQLPN